jgi:hypothetical protein
MLGESSHLQKPVRILAMTIDTNSDAIAEQKAHAATVTISPWVNQPLADPRGILSSRHLARLTRGPPRVLRGLALIGKFSRRKLFRGRAIGWCRAEVLDWMSRDLSVEVERHERLSAARRDARLHPLQECLLLGISNSTRTVPR